MSAQPMHDEEYERPGILSRAKKFFWGEEDLDEFEEEITHHDNEAQAPRRQQHLRIHNLRTSRVNVRRNAQVYEDAKAAADGLKSGQQQIVNLERATPQMTERIIDFLNGACYALDGTVERVGDKVVMFVPANVIVDIDEGVSANTSAARRTSYSE
jgi:cell division inhibitor SepF